ncbi:MAG: ribonuclease PH [Elusimicrobia bacterium]|nr:ribonuclease PH [Elusimicrobiota bacterium]
MPLSVRPLKIVRPFLKQGSDSCLFQMGLTRVLCVATVEERRPPHAEEKGIGWVSGEYAMLPRAGARRTPRARGGGGGRVQEISRLLGRSLRAVVDLAALSPFGAVVDCDVLQADGGTRTASINGGFIALVDALRGLYRSGRLAAWPVKDYLTAVSVGFCEGKLFLDPAYELDVKADVDMNVVLTGSGRLVEIQGTAEGKSFSRAELDRMLEAAGRGARQILSLQKKVLKSLDAPKRKSFSVLPES